jgi:O-antigen/teichoic acid export membrane protein
MALLPLAAGLQNLGGDTLSGADFQSRRLAAGVIGLVVTIATVAIGGFRYGVVGAVAGYMGGQLLTAALIWMMVFILQHRRAAHA